MPDFDAKTKLDALYKHLDSFLKLASLLLAANVAGPWILLVGFKAGPTSTALESLLRCSEQEYYWRACIF
jgi:hypothetical protein